MGVSIVRQELSTMLETYNRISDAIAGELVIKRKTTKYLPKPSECKSVTDARYQAYLTRAVYYNVTKPTRDALVGQLFLRPPVIDLPTEFDSFLQNANSEGLTLEQLVRYAANHVLPYGRGGFLADFPETQGEITQSEIESGDVRPIIKFYEPWAITNWRVDKVGDVGKLTLLVLKEVRESINGSDEFDLKLTDWYRVYRLSNGVVTCQLYMEETAFNAPMVIKDATGQPFDAIPFEFIGSLNNDADIDPAPFFDLANLNLAHFRNSADYEESVFLVGQPTPVYSGLTQEWVDDNFKEGVQFGSRASIPLPVGGKAELLQALPNSLAIEAMQHKEEQMFSIGAKIVKRDNTVERKEKEVEIEAASQTSVLMSVKENLEKALFASIKNCSKFLGVEITDEHKVKLNENFDLTSMPADEMRSVLELYNGKVVTFSELRDALRRSGIAKMTDEEAQTEIKETAKFIEEVTPKPEPVMPGSGGANKPPVGKPKPKPKQD
jgi:hypothetical protein